jgi:hypothetical protein
MKGQLGGGCDALRMQPGSDISYHLGLHKFKCQQQLPLAIGMQDASQPLAFELQKLPLCRALLCANCRQTIPGGQGCCIHHAVMQMCLSSKERSCSATSFLQLGHGRT